jgi:hypothetical protein
LLDELFHPVITNAPGQVFKISSSECAEDARASSLHLVASRNVSTWSNYCSSDTRIQVHYATLAAAANARRPPPRKGSIAG